MKKTETPQSLITVLEHLELNGQQTNKDLILATGLAPRTVRFALRRLKEEGVVVEKFNFRDARQMLYSVKTGASLSPTAAA